MAAWVEASALVQAVTTASLASASSELQPSVESLQRFFGEDGERLLLDPVSVYKKRKPYERALSANQDHAAALDDLVRQLPVLVSLPGREIAELDGPEHGASWRARWLRWQRSARAIPLRSPCVENFVGPVPDGTPLAAIGESSLWTDCVLDQARRARPSTEGGPPRG